MITALFPATYIAIDAACDEARREIWAQEKMIDAQSGIAGEGVPEILPECVDALFGMELPDRICPTLFHEIGIGFAHLRAEQGIVAPAFRRIHVNVGRHDIIIAREDH